MRSIAPLAAAVLLAGAATWIVRAQTPDTPPDFATWLEGVRVEALAKGISPATLSAAFADVKEPEAVIVARDRAQPEQVQSRDCYLQQRVTTEVRRSAQSHANRQATLLASVEASYGVSPSAIVSIWGLESNFGRFTGTRPIVAALATLAYDPRRSALFRSELFHAADSPYEVAVPVT